MKKLSMVLIAITLSLLAFSHAARAAEQDANAVWDEHLLSLLQEEPKAQTAEELKANESFTNAIEGQMQDGKSDPMQSRLNRSPAKLALLKL